MTRDKQLPDLNLSFAHSHGHCIERAWSQSSSSLEKKKKKKNPSIESCLMHFNSIFNKYQIISYMQTYTVS